jgi:ADP-heptose:LPS heptosyltransferase
MFNRMRNTYPGAKIYLLQFEKNKELTLLLDLVAADQVLTIDDRSFFHFAKDVLKTLWNLRSEAVDTVIDCELFSRISSIFSMLSGASIRVGFHPHTQEGLYRGAFINRPVLYNPYRHISRQFMSLADAIQSTTIPSPKDLSGEEELTTEPVVVTSTEMNRMARRLETLDNWRRDNPPDILMYPGGGILPIRAWPATKYQKLCQRLIANGYTVGIIGTSQDRGLAQRILNGLPENQSLDLTGFTRTLRELITLFHMARLLITNDGGPGQFAALAPISTIIFFGPETPILYRPIGDRTKVFYTHAACSPCLTAYNHRNSPCDGDNRCLKSIDVHPVHRKALELLSSCPASDVEEGRIELGSTGR